MDNEQEITLEMLLPLRDHMDEKQIKRFSDYLAHQKPIEPFTYQELQSLENKRIKHIAYYRRLQEEILRRRKG